MDALVTGALVVALVTGIATIFGRYMGFRTETISANHGDGIRYFGVRTRRAALIRAVGGKDPDYHLDILKHMKVQIVVTPDGWTTWEKLNRK